MLLQKCEICGAKFKGVSSKFAVKRHIREYHIDNNLVGKEFLYSGERISIES